MENQSGKRSFSIDGTRPTISLFIPFVFFHTITLHRVQTFGKLRCRVLSVCSSISCFSALLDSLPQLCFSAILAFFWLLTSSVKFHIIWLIVAFILSWTKKNFQTRKLTLTLQFSFTFFLSFTNRLFEVFSIVFYWLQQFPEVRVVRAPKLNWFPSTVFFQFSSSLALPFCFLFLNLFHHSKVLLNKALGSQKSSIRILWVFMY